jgi:acetoin utilization deacetylase AcuC-like enzyme
VAPNRLLYLHHESSLAHDPSAHTAGHPDVPARIAAIEAALQRDGYRGLEPRTTPAATSDELTLVHTPEHIEHIQTLARQGGGQIDEDTHVGPRSYEAALHAAGGACELARHLVAHGGAGFAALRPAGHHAEPDRAMGFCLLNNVAVAAALAVAELGAHRVMIIDWDVHHGNGTAEAFRHRRDVLYASIHQVGLFPGTGETADMGSGDGRGYTINVPVPRGSDDEVWISVLEHVIVPVGLEYRPDLVLISAGFDAHRADPIGGCRLEAESFGQMACLVRDLGAPVGAVLEGGYDPSALAGSVMATLAALRGEGEADSIAPDPLITARAAAHVGHYWTL